MKIIFVSNYINHHQIPLSNKLYELTQGEYRFIQTQPMEEERVNMGWDSEVDSIPYLLKYYEDAFSCQKLIEESDIVLFGGVDDESYIADRLRAGKPIIRISERLYKDGQWKAVSPRGLFKKYNDHTKYRKAPVYLLCAGAYVASDFHIVRAYPKKMYQWGYFPQEEELDIDKVLTQKQEKDYVELLWAGRFIDWKHPEKALLTARKLKEEGYPFRLTMVGGGTLKETMEEQIQKEGLTDVVKLTGFQTPQQVREHMKRADIFLFTSDYKEGWGAVLNEAMNSGCAVVANCAIGATPYLIRQGENGFLYQNKNDRQLLEQVRMLLTDRGLRIKMGKAAYETILGTWNASQAAQALLALCQRILGESENLPPKNGPGSKAEIISPGKMYKTCLKQTKR